MAGVERGIPSKQSMFQFFLEFQHLSISSEKLLHMENHKFGLPVPGPMVAKEQNPNTG